MGSRARARRRGARRRFSAGLGGRRAAGRAPRALEAAASTGRAPKQGSPVLARPNKPHDANSRPARRLSAPSSTWTAQSRAQQQCSPRPIPRHRQCRHQYRLQWRPRRSRHLQWLHPTLPQRRPPHRHRRPLHLPLCLPPHQSLRRPLRLPLLRPPQFQLRHQCRPLRFLRPLHLRCPRLLRWPQRPCLLRHHCRSRRQPRHQCQRPPPCRLS